MRSTALPAAPCAHQRHPDSQPQRQGGRAMATGPRLLAVAVAILVALAAMPARSSDPISVLPGTPGVTWSRGTASWLAEFFVGVNDFVFLGRFVSWAQDTALHGSEYFVQCRVDSVLMGYAPDSVVTFRRLIRPSFAASALRPGARVLGRFSRRCTLEGEPCGDFMLVGEDGVLLSDHISDDQMTDKATDPRPLRVVDLPGDVLRAGGLDVRLHDAEGLAMAFLTDHQRLASGGLWRVVEPHWIVGRGAQLPQFVHFRRGENCYTEYQGNSFLLPVPLGFSGDTLFVDYCPRVLVVKSGEVLALGVKPSALDSLIRPSPTGGLELVVESSGRTNPK